MKLQSIVFPEQDVIEKRDLYYRSSEEIVIKDRKTTVLSKGAVISFDTYFNALSNGKWKEYTGIQKAGFRMKISGSCHVSLIKKVRTGRHWEESMIAEWDAEGSIHPETGMDFELSDETGIIYVKIEALSEQTQISNLQFYTDRCDVNKVKMAIVMCTFRREKYVKKNIDILKKALLTNPDSLLYRRLDIYIIDNGNSLVKEEFQEEHIFLFPNINTGGSGGFTRGIIEVLHRKKECGYTNILLMDDDVVIEPEAMERTYTLLSLLNQKYQGSFIGGAMLRNDRPCVLQEAGAVWNGDACAINRGLDLKQPENIAALDSFEHGDYNAWWYCCFTTESVGLDNLPLPFFIHGDDIEYGLRNCRNLILMNGIGVWHDVFEGKRSSALEFYDIRNYLIINGIYRKNLSVFKISAMIVKRTMSNVLRLRYKDALLNIYGIEEYLKGPEYWKNLDITEKHDEIRALGYQTVPFRENGESYLKISDRKNVGKSNIIISLLTLNGALLPKIKKTVIVSNTNRICTFFRIGKACYLEPDGKSAVFVKFSLKEMLETQGRLARALLRLIIRYRKLRCNYEKELNNLKKEEYWRKHIGIEL